MVAVGGSYTVWSDGDLVSMVLVQGMVDGICLHAMSTRIYWAFHAVVMFIVAVMAIVSDPIIADWRSIAAYSTPNHCVVFTYCVSRLGVSVEA